MNSVKNLTDKLINEKFYGKEPIVKKKVSSKDDLDLIKALNWYNTMSEQKDKDKWLLDYMKQNSYKKDVINKILNLNSLEKIYKNSAAVLIRMQNNGTEFVDDMAGVIDNKLNHVLKNLDYDLFVEEETPKIISIQERIKAIAEPHVIFIDDEISSWYENRKTKIDFSLYDYLQKNQLTAHTCSHIKTLITSRYEEHKDLMSGDEQLVESYSFLSITSKKQIMKNLQLFVDDIERYVGNVKATKPKQVRKKKSISIEKQINKLKYQREFSKLKIKSVPPETIIGAQQLWIFNTKYNQLTLLNSNSSSGLLIKGTTIINFDSETSQKKTIRKPEEVIKKVLSGGKTVLKKVMSELKTKPIEVNGRINDDCILLKVIK